MGSEVKNTFIFLHHENLLRIHLNSTNLISFESSGGKPPWPWTSITVYSSVVVASLISTLATLFKASLKFKCSGAFYCGQKCHFHRRTCMFTRWKNFHMTPRTNPDRPTTSLLHVSWVYNWKERSIKWSFSNRGHCSYITYMSLSETTDKICVHMSTMQP